jgi:hypothetical protein
MALLDLGMQYSLQKPLKSYWTNLVLETEQAIKLLDGRVQNTYRILAAKKLRQIYNSNDNRNITHKRQLYILRNINQKITVENAVITQAHKGKTIVIIYKHDYFNKTCTFLSENNFHILQNNPINKDQARIQKTLRQCNLISHKKQIKYLIQKNLSPLH